MLKYYDELVYYVQKMTNDKQLALEIIQETYAKTLEKQKDTTIENERAFLYKVARNLTFDYSKKEKSNNLLNLKKIDIFVQLMIQPDGILLEDKKRITFRST